MMQKAPQSRLTPSQALAQLQNPPKSEVSKEGAKASSGVLAALRAEIKTLKEEHKAINQESDELKSSTGTSNAIIYTHLQVLKKKKLALKDRIYRMEQLLEQSS